MLVVNYELVLSYIHKIYILDTMIIMFEDLRNGYNSTALLNRGKNNSFSSIESKKSDSDTTFLFFLMLTTICIKKEQYSKQFSQ